MTASGLMPKAARSPAPDSATMRLVFLLYVTLSPLSVVNVAVSASVPRVSCKTGTVSNVFPPSVSPHAARAKTENRHTSAAASSTAADFTLLRFFIYKFPLLIFFESSQL